ncbi:MAG: hypothetical protein NVSMB26_22290 [Beijerinckiaceae bacterium]
MKSWIIGGAALLALAAAPQMTFAQSPSGAAAGAVGGAAVGGAVGGPVGAAAGAATGAAVGGLTGPNRTRFRDYAIREHRVNSYRYKEKLHAGVVLPEAGVTYYDVPAEYGVRDYRYTIVNDTPVLVEPRTRRVIEVID